MNRKKNSSLILRLRQTAAGWVCLKSRSWVGARLAGGGRRTRATGDIGHDKKYGDALIMLVGALAAIAKTARSRSATKNSKTPAAAPAAGTYRVITTRARIQSCCSVASSPENATTGDLAKSLGRNVGEVAEWPNAAVC